MLQISQGKPDAGCFKVFIPGNKSVKVGETIECKHPQTGKKTTGICKYIINEPWHLIPDWICFETYGLTGSPLLKAFQERFPDFLNHQTIKILIIKQN